MSESHCSECGAGKVQGYCPVCDWHEEPATADPSCCGNCGTKTITGFCPQCEWNESQGDEFLIIACDHRNNPDRKWTRADLGVAKHIANSAVMGLNYGKASVYNIYGGHPSNSLYEVTPSGGKDMPES